MTLLQKCSLFKSLMVMACIMCPGCKSDNYRNDDKCLKCNDVNDTNVNDVKINRDNKRSLKRNGKKKRKNKSNSIVDSGATIHCIKDKNLFTNLDYSRKVSLKVADNKVMTGEAVGDCIMKLMGDDGRLHDVILHNCVYSPHFAHNLISCRKLWRDSRMASHFGDTNYLKCAHTNTKFHFNFSNQFKLESFRAQHEINVSDHCDPNTLHERFNHASSDKIRKLLTRSIGSNLNPNHINDNHHDCIGCRLGGARKSKFKRAESQKFSYFGERISSDLCGPFPKSVDGFRYALCFVDSYTNYLKVYMLKTKSSDEVREAFNSFINEVRHFLPKDPNKIIRWHTDNGGEFMSKNLNEFCDEFAIKRSFSVPYAPPQNAHAERMWGLLLRPIRTMLAHTSVNEKFWSYAMLHACNVHNIMPSSKLSNEISPHEALHGEKPDISKFKVWGCICYYFSAGS